MFDYHRGMTLLGQRSFNDLGVPLSDVTFCVLDLETTGVGPDREEITEIGAVRYEQGVETGRFQTLVNPGRAIPPQITVVTGITQAMVIDAPRIGEALPSFLEFLGDAVIVGHNVSFDISFLNAAAIRQGYGRLANPSTDTMRLARRLVPKETRSLKLSALAAHFRSPTTPNHRALDDALATAHVFWSLLERAGSIGVTHLDGLLELPYIKGSRAIGKLNKTEHLPRRPGVYRFVDSAGAVLYVGKATNLRSRVRSYFAGDTRRRIDDLLRDMAEITHTETSCEFEASIMELREIASERPLYNRKSKPPRSLQWVRLTNERYPRLQVARSPGDHRAVLGPFRSRRTAERVMHALWDGSSIRRCGTPCKGHRYETVTGAMCPCQGDRDRAYAEVIAHVLRAMTDDPGSILTDVAALMQRFVGHARFEDAAAVRDRWMAFLRASHDRRLWLSLRRAGTIVATDETEGVTAVISDGALSTIGPREISSPLTLSQPRLNDLPTSMSVLEEARLVWAWLDRPSVTIDEVTGEWTEPACPIPTMEALQATLDPGGTGTSGRSRTTPSSVSAPITKTSERNPPTRSGSNPATTTTWEPTRSGSV